MCLLEFGEVDEGKSIIHSSAELGWLSPAAGQEGACMQP